MAVAMCPTNQYDQYVHLDRYYSSMEGTPSPPSSVPQHVVPEYYQEFEDDAFHSDEELQKVSSVAIIVVCTVLKLRVHCWRDKLITSIISPALECLPTSL